MAEINYDEIKTEYISSDVSVSSLARKYGVARSSLCALAKKEQWETIRRQAKDKARQKTIEQISDKRASVADKCIRIIEKLVDKVEESVDMVAPSDIAGKKQLVAMMKDLCEIGIFNTESSDSHDIQVQFEVDDYND